MRTLAQLAQLWSPSTGQRYITSLIMDAIYDLLWYFMHDQTPESDPARLTSFKVGPQQEKPYSVTMMIYESDLVSPEGWAHTPDRLLTSLPGETDLSAPGGARIRGSRIPPARGSIGGTDYGYQRAFTLQTEFWMRLAGVSSTTKQEGRELLDRYSGIAAGRARWLLEEAGIFIGRDTTIVDSFTEYVNGGPFFGNEWVLKQPGEARYTQRMTQFWYRTAYQGE